MKKLSLLTLIILMTIINVNAQDEKLGKISGLMFGDYFTVPANHDSSRVGANGFWFRRIYLTYEKDIQEKFSIRVRMEMGSAGDFGTRATTLVPFVKDAYFKWKINDNHQMTVGISEPPTLRVIEKAWGHRFLEKTPLDLNRWAPSRETGVSVRGNVIKSGKVKYNVMLANGNGNKSEINKGKKAMASLGFHPTDNLTFEIYGDYNDNQGESDWMTYQVYGGYTNGKISTGLMYAHQSRRYEDNIKPDVDLGIVSAFFVNHFNEKLALVLRADRNLEPNPDGERISYLPMSNEASNTLYIAGLDIKPTKNLTLTPNIEYINYDEAESGVTPDSDLFLRMTFFFKF